MRFSIDRSIFRIILGTFCNVLCSFAVMVITDTDIMIKNNSRGIFAFILLAYVNGFLFEKVFGTPHPIEIPAEIKKDL